MRGAAPWAAGPIAAAPGNLRMVHPAPELAAAYSMTTDRGPAR
jgi:hypothetical protein